MNELPANPRRADWEIIRNHQQGDPQAFPVFLERNANQLFTLCSWLLADPQQAASATEEVFVRLYSVLAKERDRTALGFTIYKTALTICRAKQGDPELGDHSQVEQHHNPSVRLEATTRSNLSPPQILKAVWKLDEGRRITLFLHDLVGLPYRTIGKLLDIPEQTARARLHRARLELVSAITTEDRPHRDPTRAP